VRPVRAGAEPATLRSEAHLDACTGCARYVEQLRTTIALSGATRGLEDRPEVAGLLAAFRESRRDTAR